MKLVIEVDLEAGDQASSNVCLPLIQELVRVLHSSVPDSADMRSPLLSDPEKEVVALMETALHLDPLRESARMYISRETYKPQPISPKDHRSFHVRGITPQGVVEDSGDFKDHDEAIEAVNRMVAAHKSASEDESLN